MLHLYKHKFTKMISRLERFMNEEGLTNAKLAEILDIQRSGLSHILSGRNKPSYDFIEKLVTNFPNLNIMWLITGQEGTTQTTQVDPTSILNNTNTLINSKEEPYPLQSSVKESFSTTPHKYEDVEKIVLIYSDGTFDVIRKRENK